MPQNRNTEPRPLAEALDGVVRSLQGGHERHGGQPPGPGAVAVGGVFGRWSEIVGEPMAAEVQPVKLDGRRLVVAVREPAWATQVKLFTDRIRERIKDVAGVEVDAIDVRVGGSGR